MPGNTKRSDPVVSLFRLRRYRIILFRRPPIIHHEKFTAENTPTILDTYTGYNVNDSGVQITEYQRDPGVGASFVYVGGHLK